MKKTIKNLFLVIIMLFGIKAFSQTFPYGINYQAVARDANGNAQSNKPINYRFTIYKTSAAGTKVWQETPVSAPTTNAMGQFNAVIGSGQPVSPFTTASFSQINWSNDNYFLLVEIETGIGVYTPIGTAQQFQSVPYALAAPDPTPAGVVSAFVGVSAPVGYLMCHGQAVARPVGGVGVYANLFAVIGTAYGNGDGSTTFNVPDFRGMFLRGTDSTAINDPNAATRTAVNGGNSGAKVGSYEADAFQGHWHNFRYNVSSANGSWAGNNNGNGSNDPGVVTNPISDGTNGTPRTTSETRPKNIYVNYIIKY